MRTGLIKTADFLLSKLKQVGNDVLINTKIMQFVKMLAKLDVNCDWKYQESIRLLQIRF